MYLPFGISVRRWMMFWHSGSSHKAFRRRTFGGQRSRRIPSTTSGIQTALLPAHCRRERKTWLICAAYTVDVILMIFFQSGMSKHKCALQSNKIPNDRPTKMYNKVY